MDTPTLLTPSLLLVDALLTLGLTASLGVVGGAALWVLPWSEAELVRSSAVLGRITRRAVEGGRAPAGLRTLVARAAA